MQVANNVSNFIRFHHIGVAVKSFDKSIIYYKNLGYECSDIINDEIQNVELVYCKSKTFPNVELIKPVNENSPVYSILQKNDTQIYHQCYQTKDLKKALEFLQRKNKIFCISKPKTAILFNNKKVSFYQIPNVGLIEILEVENYE
jgi:methylmalonyl-CoA/ethylmalonyl-CoA epimerase